MLRLVVECMDQTTAPARFERKENEVPPSCDPHTSGRCSSGAWPPSREGPSRSAPASPPCAAPAPRPRFNLLREESEGYAKLATLLNQRAAGCLSDDAVPAVVGAAVLSVA